MKKIFAAAALLGLSGCIDLSDFQSQYNIEVQTFEEYGPKIKPFRH